MIFVTVGHQMPFDRLVRLVDVWASQLRSEIFAQVGPSRYRPKHFQYIDFLSPEQFEQKLKQSTAIVSHAGTGTIIQALVHRKPMLVLPRLASRGETRSDHQVGTARHFEQTGQLLAAYDDDQFLRRLDEISTFRSRMALSSSASEQLLTQLRIFVESVESTAASSPVFR